MICFHHMHSEYIWLLLNVVRCSRSNATFYTFLRGPNSFNGSFSSLEDGDSAGQIHANSACFDWELSLLLPFKACKRRKKGRSLITKPEAICDNSHSIRRRNSSLRSYQPYVSTWQGLNPSSTLQTTSRSDSISLSKSVPPILITIFGHRLLAFYDRSTNSSSAATPLSLISLRAVHRSKRPVNSMQHCGYVR